LKGSSLMSYPNIPFKSYCWCIGTTSFRTDKLNLKIERQLDLLHAFRKLDENIGAVWEGNNALQERYYDYMRNNGFLTGNAKRKGKDAREKTSGLVDIGLIDNQRELTDVGFELLELSKKGNFKINNEFRIPADSFIYFKQLLKTSVIVDGKVVRPLIILAKVLSEVDYLTLCEFAYLLPLCVDRESTKSIIESIPKIRNHELTIDELIIHTLMSKENYQEAFSLFMSNLVDEDLICTVGMNRKSRKYDKSYFYFYQLLKDVVLHNNSDSIYPLYKASKKINGKAGTLWRKLLFNTSSSKTIAKTPADVLKNCNILKSKDLSDFKMYFFYNMHLFKAKATLNDYRDLNRRYFRITDTVLFEDDKVQFDIIPKYFFKSKSNALLNIAFEISDLLHKNSTMIEISPIFTYSNEPLFSGIRDDYGFNVRTVSEALNVIDDERYRRFNHLIDTKFPDNILLKLLDNFESRNDNEIFLTVTDNADIPTIFEYILGIIWYKVSERKGDILKYMNLSLEANLLPKSHASGGSADIEYYYPQTEYYPEHYLLLEATLAENTNQRRMEMEPVSRHLGEHIIKSGNKNTYCVFASTSLHRNVISDFRNRRTYEYYSDEYETCVNGLKILPLQTSALKGLIKNGKQYSEIYSILDEAYQSSEPIPTWYEKLEQKLISSDC